MPRTTEVTKASEASLRASLRIMSRKPGAPYIPQLMYIYINCGYFFCVTSADIVDHTLVSIQGTTLFGFICATINIAMVPSYAYIVDINLVLPQVTTLFGFIFATINTTMMPNYSNIMLICHVLLKIPLLGCSIIAPLHLTSKLLIASIPASHLPSLATTTLIIPIPILFWNNRTTCTTVPRRTIDAVIVA